MHQVCDTTSRGHEAGRQGRPDQRRAAHRPPRGPLLRPHVPGAANPGEKPAQVCAQRGVRGGGQGRGAALTSPVLLILERNLRRCIKGGRGRGGRRRAQGGLSLDRQSHQTFSPYCLHPHSDAAAEPESPLKRAPPLHLATNDRLTPFPPCSSHSNAAAEPETPHERCSCLPLMTSSPPLPPLPTAMRPQSPRPPTSVGSCGMCCPGSGRRWRRSGSLPRS